MRLEQFEGLVDIDSNLGRVFPSLPLKPLPDKGARFHGLSRLKEFIGRLTFQRTIAGDKTQSFKVPRDKIQIFTPDTAAENPQLPGIAFIPGSYSYDEKWVYSLGRAEEDDNTIDKYGKGTALVLLGYYTEDFTIESVAAKYPTVRGINEGIRQAMRQFADGRMLYLKCPDYFDQEACFTIISGAGYSPDMASEVLGRRTAHLQVEFWIPEVVLINYKTMRIIPDYGPDGSFIRDGNIYSDIG